MLKNKKLLKQIAIVATAMVVAVAAAALVPSVLAQGFISPQDNPAAVAGATGAQGNIRNLIQTMLSFLLGFLGLVAVIMIIYGGILYVTAGGNEENATKGKKILMYAVVGIVIIFISYALVNTLLGGLGTGTDRPVQ
ncbi:pilin [Patescibacteria group bacterium]|nr:pilin [Patescibacteria group bacterium]